MLEPSITGFSKFSATNYEVEKSTYFKADTNNVSTVICVEKYNFNLHIVAVLFLEHPLRSRFISVAIKYSQDVTVTFHSKYRNNFLKLLHLTGHAASNYSRPLLLAGDLQRSVSN